jgi:hypothetical protein
LFKRGLRQGYRRIAYSTSIDLNLRQQQIPTLRKLKPPNCRLRKFGLLLLEVYFKRIYNATLLFHKSIAFQLYMQNDIPDYLLRSIFAQAAIFCSKLTRHTNNTLRYFLCIHFSKILGHGRVPRVRKSSPTPTSPLSLGYKLFGFCNFAISRRARSNGPSFTHLLPIN